MGWELPCLVERHTSLPSSKSAFHMESTWTLRWFAHIMWLIVTPLQVTVSTRTRHMASSQGNGFHLCGESVLFPFCRKLLYTCLTVSAFPCLSQNRLLRQFRAQMVLRFVTHFNLAQSFRRLSNCYWETVDWCWNLWDTRTALYVSTVQKS